MSLASIPQLYTPVNKSSRVNLAEQIPLPRPLVVYIEPGNACNFKCVFCPESLPDYKEKAGGLFMLSMKEFNHIAEQIKEIAPIKLINFYMLGEPFANKLLTQFIRAARDMNLAETLIVTSNGTLVKPDKYEAICSSGLDFLRISIYGATEETHRARTQSSIPLAQIKDNIAGLKKYRDGLGLKAPYIYVKMITANEEENIAFTELFGPHCDKIQIEPVHNWAEEDQAKLSLLDDGTMLKQHYFDNKKQVCPFPFYMSIIHSDLNVSVCGVDWAKLTVVGNLRTETLMEVWRGKKLRDFQLKHLQRRRGELAACASCTYLHGAVDNIDVLTDAALK